PWLRSLDSARLRVLVSDLPSLGRLFEGLPLPPPDALGDPGLEKTRLFEAMLRLIERLAEETPVALFLDDLDRSDSCSLELLCYLARGLIDQPILLLASYRTDAPNTRGRLRALIGSLERDGLAQEIAISRLSSDQVENLAQGILGGKAPGGLLPLLETRAGGTPFFVEALMTALIDSGSLVPGPSGKDGWRLDAESAVALPPSVRSLILSSLDGLGPMERRVLNVITVIGEATPHSILQVATGLQEQALDDAIEQLHAASLVTEARDGSDVVYSIGHPLVQEVAKAELPEMVRRHIHMAAIGSLELVRPSELSRLARHYRGAGPAADPNRALAVFLAAGEKARALCANEEAAGYYVDALAMVREGCQAPGYSVLGEELLPWLLERLGEVWERIGEGEAAISIWNEAMVLHSDGRERATPSPDRALAMSRLRRQLAIAEWDRGHFHTAEAHLSAGLALLTDGSTGAEPCQELADLQFTRFYIFSRLGDAAGQAESAAALLSIAQRLTSPLVEAEANLVASISCQGRMDVSAGIEHALRALSISELFSKAQDLAVCCRAHIALVSAGIRLGDHRLMRDHAEQGLAIAQRVGAPNLEVVLRLYSAHASFLSGAWSESLRCSGDALTLARRLEHPRNLAHALAARAMVLSLSGELSEAQACISEARTTFGGPSRGGSVDRYVFGLIDIAETMLALERLEAERAHAIANCFVLPSESNTVPSFLTQSNMPMGLMLRAETEIATGDPQRALETAGKLLALIPEGAPYLEALSCRAEGLARDALGQPEAAMECMARAHKGFTALEMPFEAARSLLEWATVAMTGQPSAAAVAARASLAVLDHLGARNHADRCRRLLRQFGVPPPISRRTPPNGCPLSQREIEVARLVAEGLTTAEIAKRLQLSWRTIDHHLERIYGRLGIGSRASLTRYIIEAGLLLPASYQN
ncbi:MAG: LuxR C-terminal-related transcriptional regulator, partial [Dehalococcoidia bacterium]|nr:LuxR C-terminal-related transcriptional regulator [Dehalococcoidia bacterium]